MRDRILNVILLSLLTTEVDNPTVRLNIFQMAVDHDIGIQMKREELTKTLMTISNLKKKLVSMVYLKLFQRCKGFSWTPHVDDWELFNWSRMWFRWRTIGQLTFTRSVESVVDLYHITIINLGSLQCVGSNKLGYGMDTFIITCAGPKVRKIHQYFNHLHCPTASDFTMSSTVR